MKFPNHVMQLNFTQLRLNLQTSKTTVKNNPLPPPSALRIKSYGATSIHNKMLIHELINKMWKTNSYQNLPLNPNISLLHYRIAAYLIH